MKIDVGIIGVTGYAGGELLKILLTHPDVFLRYLGSRQVKKPLPVGELLPFFRSVKELKVQPLRLHRALQSDLLFLALPHGVAMGLVPQILRRSTCRVIDLSGDFRLRSALRYRSAYRMGHTHPSLLQEAVYGLTEWARNRLPKARLVANPGCYPTAVLLGLAPLAKARLLAHEGLVIDAKSGATGAGRSLNPELLFSEVNEDLRAYKVNAHPHIPEMEQTLSDWSGASIRMTFVPHLVPMNRGLYASLYAPLKRPMAEGQVRSLYRKAYGKEPFVLILPKGVWPQVRSVEGTNRCEIGLRVANGGRRAIVLVAIDNLGKGAAGQAVQNMNRMFGLPETAGLLPPSST